MTLESFVSRKYHIATYGCQMNEYDSGLIAAAMEERGCVATEDPWEADYILVNTCSVRGKAEETAYARIFQFKPIKESKPHLRIAVLGCMAKNQGAKMLETLRHVDYVLGPDNYKELPYLLFDAPAPARKPSRAERAHRVITEFDAVENYLGQSAKQSNGVSGFVTIQRGCNKHCSYCIVPYVRGPEKYRDPADVLREISGAVASGISEITLLGQTVNSYKSGDLNFARLLLQVAEIPGLQRIRFTSPHPRHYTPELIDVLRSTPKLCPHVHLPVQSGSDAQLRKMRRQYTRDEYLRIVESLRGWNPYYGITTDIICGFVDETEDDFQQTLALVREAQFDSAFMFIYSPREGTTAYNEAETVSEAEKKDRLERLIVVQNEITLARNKAMLGRRETILLEGPSSRAADEWVGKTGNFKKVILPAAPGLQAGSYVDCLINDIRGWTLRGDAI
jgi:tRNA-2-methylthio-N6-dimethylallyladenosine synthase